MLGIEITQYLRALTDFDKFSPKELLEDVYRIEQSLSEMKNGTFVPFDIYHECSNSNGKQAKESHYEEGEYEEGFNIYEDEKESDNNVYYFNEFEDENDSDVFSYGFYSGLMKLIILCLYQVI